MPATDIDLVTAAHKRLSAFPPFQELVLEGRIGHDAAEDAEDAEKLASAWFFQGLSDEGRPYRDPEGSGTSVVVLTQRGDWAAANQHNTAWFPALQLLIYTDSTRDVDGGVDFLDAEAKCRHIFKRLDRCFHLPGNDDHFWGDSLWVHSSVRGTGFTIRDVPNTQSATVRGEATYNTITD